MVLASSAQIDGWIARSPGFPDIARNDNALLIGDHDGTNQDAYRSIVSFPNSALPAGATITKAVLRVYQLHVIGTPYVTHGSVQVGHLIVGPALVEAAYDHPLLSTPGLISTDRTEGYKELDVTSAVLADRASGRGLTQFRLEFAVMDSNGDGQNSLATFEDGNGSQGTNNIPQLHLTYVE
jgi:hypothetical protein